MNGHPALVSTVVTVYNRPVLLADAVNSVLAQTYRPIEIVIVDDGSTDDTGAVGERFAAAHPEVVRYVRKPRNEGYARAINTGLQQITGEFVQLLDSDDVLMPEKFALQVEGLRSRPECAISYCYAREYALGATPAIHPARRTGESIETLSPAIFEGKLWPSPVPLYRRELIDAAGFYLESSIYPEWEYECRTAAAGIRLHHSPNFLVDVRGAHAAEGRVKGGTPAAKLRDYAAIVDRVVGHARDCGVQGAASASLSRRAFAVGRKCAAAGFEPEAWQCTALALETARSRWQRRRITCFLAASERFGWRPVARAYDALDRSMVIRVLRACRAWPPRVVARWSHRHRAAQRLLRGERVSKWPALLVHEWLNRSSRSKGNAA